MSPQDAIDIGREGLYTAMLVGAPVLIVGAAVGLLIGLLQALTQVQDQTIAFVPKIIAMFVALSICLPWLIEMMMQYCTELFSNVPNVISGG